MHISPLILLSAFLNANPTIIIANYTDRNLLEYASERRDWRNVCQEEEMYLCGATRDLIHPVHLETGRYHFSTGGRCERSSYS